MLRRLPLALLALSCNAGGPAATTVLSTSTSGHGDGSTNSGSGSTGPTTGAVTSAATVMSTEASVGSSSTAGDTSPLHDVGWDSDLGTGKPAGCQGKIDFLFVISAIDAYELKQEKLLAALPTFIDEIEARFDDFDYHIMVVNAEQSWGIDHCTDNCPDLTCKRGEPCCPLKLPPGSPCCGIEDYPCESLGLVEECDTTLGAGVVFPAGLNASNTLCKVDDGRRFLTATQTDLDETFECVARVGSMGGHQTWPMASMLAAVGPQLNGPDGCNEGFLRDDALLMVTLFAPAADYESEGNPTSWAQALVDAKGGDPGAIVVYFIGDGECPHYDWPCLMTKKLPYHLIVDDVAGDYSAGFEQAAGLVDEACALLIPR